MDYIFHSDGESLQKMITIFIDSCLKQGIGMGRIKASMILMRFIDEAKKQGVIEEVAEE